MHENNKTVVTLTQAAAKHIKNVLQKKPDSLAFRLSIKQAGCTGYMYVPQIICELNTGDIKIENEYGIEFYIDNKWLEVLRGTKIDYIEKTLGMKQLEFINPNAESLCGCGESFNLKGKINE